jgi:hypothetical protein
VRFFPSIALAMCVTISVGFADDSAATACLVNAPSYSLSSDSVVWYMSIGSGQSCLRGLRANLATLDEIKLVTPPQFGQVALEGPAFLYRGDSDFRGQDSFTLQVSGMINRIKGSSTIQVMVLVR